VTDLKVAEESQKQYLAQAREEQARLSALLSAMNIGILFVGRDNKVLYTNPAFYLIWMIRAGTLIVGMNASEVLRNSANATMISEYSLNNILRAPDPGGALESIEIQMADGRLVTQLCYPVRDDDKRLVGHLWIYEDITRERQTADQLIYLAERDALTGLYNRHGFQ
jgi:PAS domain-containing protein